MKKRFIRLIKLGIGKSEITRDTQLFNEPSIAVRLKKKKKKKSKTMRLGHLRRISNRKFAASWLDDVVIT